MKQVTQCKRCIMDDSGDPTIVFDKNGICNYCTDALRIKPRKYFPNSTGEERLNKIFSQIKEEGKGKKYDCIMGLSGGLDSSYLAYIAWKNGLRVLAVHLDDGYDTDISKKNIENLVKSTGFDFEVIAPDSYQYNQLELAFMRAGVPNLAVPQDDIVWGFLYSLMRKNNTKYFLSGENFSTESILQNGNTHRYTDVVHIKAINKQFGRAPLDKLSFVSTGKRIFEKHTQKIVSIRPLNYVEYTREKAFKELGEFCGFEYYGRKHLENKFTAFLQLKWLPEKFNVDKRKSHLSSLIVSDQMTREQALKEMEEPLYDPGQMRDYMEEIASNMGIKYEELEELVKEPAHSHTEYKTEDDTISFKIIKGLYRLKNGLRKK